MLKKSLLIVLVFTLIAAAAVFAGNKPLSLMSSSPENGADDVSVDSAIILGFSSNVVNMKISENNRDCFLLTDAAGTEIDIDVYLPDDQMEPENKRTITLTPAAPLLPGTEYAVVISADLLAKNGNSLGSELIIKFTTAE